MKRKKKPWIIAITILVVIFGGVFAFDITRALILKKIFSNFTPPPQVVSTITIKPQEWQKYLPAVGQVSAYRGVDISPEVSGRVDAIYFKSGQLVKSGEKLIQLDDSSEVAQIQSVDAQLQNAKSNLERMQRLLEQKAASQAAYDDALATEKQLKANYDNLVALQAKKLIRAPFAGQTGIAQVKVGQVVTAGQTCLSLQTVDALYVTFSVSQKDYSALSLNQPVIVKVDAYPNQKFMGHISAFDSQFDETTHSISVQAALDPSNMQLLPGMFVDVNVLLPVQQNVIVVPQTVLTYTLYGESAFVVTFNKVTEDGKDVIAKDKNGFPLGTVKKVFVRTSDKQGNKVVVLEGLKSGDVVVDSGQSKIDDGSTVAINNTLP